jgi:hypothetical protein
LLHWEFPQPLGGSDISQDVELSNWVFGSIYDHLPMPDWSKHEAMATRKDIQEAQKLTEQELKGLPSPPVLQRIDEAKTLLQTCAPADYVIDFFTAREWLQAGFGESSQRLRIYREIDNSSIYRLPGAGQVDRFEESLYWLLSAAMIIYFLLGIIGG